MNKWKVISDNLMEALILLDPPPLNTANVTTSSNSKEAIQSSTSISVHDVMNAHDMLLSTSNLIYDDIDTLSDYLPNSNSTNNNIGSCEMKPSCNNLNQHDTEDNDKNQRDTMTLTFHEKLGQMADLYRAIILSSTLLLEMWNESLITTNAYKEGSNESRHDIDLSQEQVKLLCQTIQQSILLLQRLSQIIYLATNVIPSNSATASDYDKKNVNDERQTLKNTILSLNLTNDCTNKRLYDWHDYLLPKSSYPSIQECFERKKLIDIDTGIVFGYDDRLISLFIDEYVYLELNDDKEDLEHRESDMQDKFQLAQHDNDTEKKNNLVDMDISTENVKNQSDDAFYSNDQNIIQQLSLNTKDIEKEEMILLNIAFPSIDIHDNDQRKKHNRKRNYLQGPGQQYHTNDSKRIHQVQRKKFEVIKCALPRTFIERCKEKDIFKYIKIPFTNNDETYPVIKEGFLILSMASNLSQDNNFRCKVRLFNNGIIIIMLQKNELKSVTKQNNIFVYALSSNTKKSCTFIHTNIFHFQIDNLISLYCGDNDVSSFSCNDMESIVFAIDKEEGGNFLVQGCDWTSSFDACIEVTGTVCCLCKSIKDNW